MRTRYLRITETSRGRVIEAWVREPEQVLLEDGGTDERNSPWVVASMFGWGFLGITVGNLLVAYAW